MKIVQLDRKRQMRKTMTDIRPKSSPVRAQDALQKGFTLIELMVVLTLMGILATIALPKLESTITRARESVLKSDLYQMREAIDGYYTDYGKYPDQLEDLVNGTEPSRSYLRSIPKDPFTRSADWITVAPVDEEGAIFDVHSASPLVALDGTPYNTW